MTAETTSMSEARREAIHQATNEHRDAANDAARQLEQTTREADRVRNEIVEVALDHYDQVIRAATDRFMASCEQARTL